MPVIAVVNRKGAVAKAHRPPTSRLGARNGSSVMLGDACRSVCCAAPPRGRCACGPCLK